MGIACLLGYNVWADVRPLGFWSLFADTDILDTDALGWNESQAWDELANYYRGRET